MEKSKYKDKNRDLSLLERVLEIDDNKNSNLASVLALDLFLVGIDTVSFINNLIIIFLRATYNFFFLSFTDSKCSWFNFISIGITPRQTIFII